MATELVPFEQVQSLAKAVAASKLFKGFDTPEKATVLMMICQAEGCHPVQAVQRYDVIDGRPSKKSDAMLSDYMQRGGRVDWLEMTDKEVRAVFKTPDAPPLTIAWTIEMAQKAKLADKDNWKKYPRAMMRARVVSEGIRATMPSVVAGIYTPEEVQDFDDLTPPSNHSTAEKATAIVVEATAVHAQESAQTAAAEPSKQAPTDEPKASREQVTKLCTVMTLLGIKERAAVMEWINRQIAPTSVESRLDLTVAQASKCIDAAETELNERNKQ
jgi:hypothetical protein